MGRPGEEALLKLAARGSHGIRAVPVHTHQKGRRGEMDCTGGALTAPSDPQLRCYLEDGLLDPEGGQQNWCRTLSSLPRKGGARKKRDRGRESQGTALGKFSLKFVCFCFQIHKYRELFVSTTQFTHFHLRDRTLHTGKNSPTSQGQL